MSSANKKRDSRRDSEQAPLLTDDAPNGDDDESNLGDGVEVDSKVRGWLTKAWHWLLKNLMAVVIVLLLLGGVIALCVYFAGLYAIKPPVPIILKNPSHEQSQNISKPSKHLPNTCLCPSCL